MHDIFCLLVPTLWQSLHECHVPAQSHAAQTPRRVWLQWVSLTTLSYSTAKNNSVSQEKQMYDMNMFPLRTSDRHPEESAVCAFPGGDQQAEGAALSDAISARDTAAGLCGQGCSGDLSFCYTQALSLPLSLSLSLPLSLTQTFFFSAGNGSLLILLLIYSWRLNNFRHASWDTVISHLTYVVVQLTVKLFQI